MDLLNVLKSANGGQTVGALAQQFGLNGDQAEAVLGHLVPALTQGFQNNLNKQGGLESLLGALASGNHSQYIDDPSTIGQASIAEEGAGILGHVLGGDTGGNLAQQVAGHTGIDSSVIQQMLPVVASLAMGALSKHASNNAGDAGGLLGGLGTMLDFNHDGSAVDDVVGLVGKFFSR